MTIENTEITNDEATVTPTKKPRKSRKVQTYEKEVVELAFDANELSNKVEKGEEVYFEYNGTTVSSMFTLKVGHAYNFNHLSDKAKVYVLKQFGRKNVVIASDYQGYRGILVEKNQFISPVSFTPKNVGKVKMVNLSNGKKVDKIIDPTRMGNTDNVIDVPIFGLPAVELDVVRLISKAEYDKHPKNATVISNSVTRQQRVVL
jgi:hypothetical protein